MRAHNERLVLSLVRRARAAGQDRDRPADRAVGADRLGDHAQARGRPAAAARRAAARPGRPAVGADVARPRGRVLPRRQDRAAQPRHLRTVDFAGRGPPARQRDLRLSDARATRSAACSPGVADGRGRARRRAPRGSPGSGSRCRSRSGAGPRRSARPPPRWTAWRDVDIRAELAAALPYPVYLQNDATAACGAELAFGGGAELQDFLYFYVGAFIGGGLVLNGGLFAGRTGNAAALGSMPVPGPRRPARCS